MHTELDGLLFRTGNLRWTEKSFLLNETLACLGVPAMGVDGYTAQPIQIVQPISELCLTEAYFEKNGWNDTERKFWHKLTQVHTSQEKMILSSFHSQMLIYSAF